MTTDALCILIALAAAALQSFFGFGYALFGVPLLTYALGDIKQAVLFSTVTVAFHQTVMTLWAAKRAPWLETACLSAGILAGVEVGMRVFQASSSRGLLFLLGALLVAMGLWRLLDWRPPTRDEVPFKKRWIPIAGFAGLVTGFVGVLTCATGPPLIIYANLRGWSPRFIKSFLQPLFLIAVVSRLGRFIAAGRISADWPLLWPAIFAGVVTIGLTIWGLRTAARVPPRVFDKGFYALVCVFGVVTFVKALGG